MNQFLVLYRMELRRLRTPINFALPFFFLIITGLIAFISARSADIVSFPDFFRNAAGGFLLPFGPALIGGGMLALDVKEHWARTTLLRPVTREAYLTARVAAVFTYFFISLVIAGLLPVPVTSLFVDKPVEGPWDTIAGLTLLMSLQALLIVILMTFLSCWVPGISNLAILAMWAVCSQLLSGYLTYQYWDNATLTILKEFLFPSGFLDAADELQAGGSRIFDGVFWGVAALSGFWALTVLSFNRMNVESGSE